MKKLFLTLYVVLFLLVPVSAQGEKLMDMDRDGVWDREDICPFFYNPEQAFTGLAGCKDDDLDGFEDIFWDYCPGEYGKDGGCGDGTNGLLAAEEDALAPDNFGFCSEAVLETGDTLMLLIETDSDPIVSPAVLVP